jgi:two-component system sensor histidine kinase HydH
MEKERQRSKAPLLGGVSKVFLSKGGDFRFGRRLAALSLACVIASSCGTAFVLSRFLTEHMLMREAAVSADFVESIVRAEKTWSYFEDPASSGSRPALESFFTHVARLPDVVRTNIYSPDDVVLWSSEIDLKGRHFPNNDELQRALRGELVVESGDHASSLKAEHEALDARGLRFMEIYMPVWDQRHERVIGAVEIYRLPRALFTAVDEGVRLVWISGLAGAGLLCAALVGLVRQAEQVLRSQHERLVQAETLAAVGAVASAVAHGIRNPLASIRSSAELAALEEDPAEVRTLLSDIERQADRVNGWVRDLLLTARTDAVTLGEVDVAALLADAVERCSPAAGRSGVRLRVVVAEVPPVRGNSGPLAQALDSLMMNGIEAMPQGGILFLEAAPDNHGGTVVIRVCDTGVGLPVQLARGRQPLFYSTKPQGTGLGLVLARRIVGLYDGSLDLEPGPNDCGTRVTIRLPIAV